MFILHCLDDNSDCQLADNKVIFDKSNPPRAGDKVKFYWKESSAVLNNGKVIIYTDDEKLISKKWREVTASSKANTKSVDKCNEKLIKTEKREPKPRRRWSSDEEDTTQEKPAKKRVKKLKSKQKNEVFDSGDKESQNFIKNKIFENKSDKKVEKNGQETIEKDSPKVVSPTKEEYKKLLAESERQLLELRSKVTDINKPQSSNSEPATCTTLLDSKAPLAEDNTLNNSLESYASSDNSVTKTTAGEFPDTSMIRKSIEDNKNRKEVNEKGHGSDINEKAEPSKSNTESSQLLGQFHTETMFDIGGQIFCTKSKYDQGRTSGDATTMARHLLDGIFKREAILHCTLTGQPARAQGAKRRMEKVDAINFEAKEQIIECVLKEARKKGWKKRDKKTNESREYSWTDIERTMTQRIGEIKREVSKNIELKKQLDRKK